MTKPKLCQWEGCNELAANFPNSTIKKKYCTEHAIKAAGFLAHKNRLKDEAKAKREQNAKNKQAKIDLMSVSKYRSDFVQPFINEIARLIDFGQPCIATGKYDGKMNGGHYFSVGSNPTICLNLHNIHNQSFESNHHKSGDNVRYRQGIIKTYGEHYMEQIEALKHIKPIKLNKDDLIEIKRRAAIVRDELKSDLHIRTPQERIELREEINKRLGIYK